jgi:uncharacterized phage protein gp47/JayE
VYVAGQNALVSGTQKNQLQAIYAARLFGVDATYPPDTDSNCVVYNATVEVLTVGGIVYHDAGYSSEDIKSSVESALSAYVQGLDLGAVDLSPGPANVVPVGDLYQTVENVLGVRTFKMTAPISSVEVAPSDLVTLVLSIAYVPVVSSVS